METSNISEYLQAIRAIFRLVQDFCINYYKRNGESGA